MTTVGPFELLSPLGRGGMGAVWLARHRDLGLEAAVKIVHAGARAVPEFRAEVRAMAGLDHPNVVRILDHGEIDGTPWLAMERVTEGSLRPGPLPWAAVRATLLALLDGLAHAHARGLLHRDLKLGNVLVTRDVPGGPTRILLADFGIAHPLDPDRVGAATGSSASGTPSYMAPEQFVHDVRAFGPWTDLYSLGCVVWTLATGKPPYGRGTPAQAMTAHLHGKLPPLSANGAPPGFEGFLRTLLARDPRHRFQTCADAAAALLGLDPGPVAGASVAGGGPTLSELETVLLAPAPSVVLPATSSHGSGPPPRAPFVPRWSAGPTPPPSLGWLAAARGLFGLRRPRTVARVAERDRLWAALGRVHATGRAEAVVLLGGSGSGRTHLLGWLGERATELGVATVLRAGPADGPDVLCTRWLRAGGLEGPALAEHVARRLPERVRPLALSLMRPEGASIRLEGARERHLALARVIGATTDRPVIVAFDDAHLAEDAARLAADLRASASPMLVVLTADEMALAERPVEDAAIRAIAGEQIVLPPLGPAGGFELLAGLLPLEGDVAATLVGRGGANPRWLVEVVSAWVASGDLGPGTSGFKLRAGARPPGGDVGALWEARLDGVLVELAPGEQLSVELLSALGPEVSVARWSATCRAWGVEPSTRAVERLGDLRLVASSPTEVRLLHPRLADVLERRSRAAGRWALLHEACATTATDPVDAALHRAEAGAGPEVAEALAAGFDQAWRLGRRTRAAVVLERYERVVAGMAEEAAEHVRAASMRSALLSLSGQNTAAMEAADRGLALATRSARPASLALAGRARLRVLRSVGRVDEGVAQAVDAARHAEDPRDPVLLAEIWLDHGNLLARAGRTEEAVVVLRRSLNAALGSGDAYSGAKALLALGSALGTDGRHLEARTVQEEAARLFESTGSLWGLAMIRNDLGFGYAVEGDRDRARALLEASLRDFESLGHNDVVFPRLNLAGLDLAAGELERARQQLELIIPGFAGRAIQALVRAHRLPCLAAAGEWPLLDREVAEITAELRRTGLTDRSVVGYVDLTVALAIEKGEPARAEEVRALADLLRGRLS